MIEVLLKINVILARNGSGNFDPGKYQRRYVWRWWQAGNLRAEHAKQGCLFHAAENRFKE